MSSASITVRSGRRPWPKWAQITGWSVLCILGAGLLIYIAIVTLGAVHGTEFCPETFERREYVHFELPIVQLQVTGERQNDTTGATELFLQSQKYISTPATGAQEWHVVVGSRGTKLQRKGDAHILMQYLDATEGDDVLATLKTGKAAKAAIIKSDYRWVKWSEDHPELAKVLWPAVQQLALHELYVYVPDLFQLAKSIDDAQKLKQEVNRLVADKLIELARQLEERKNQQEAAKLRQEAEALRIPPAA